MSQPATDEEWGEEHSGGGSGRTGRRILLLLVVLLVLPLLGGGAVAVYASSQITREPVDNLSSGPGPLHILVVGSDSREGLTTEQQTELTTGDEGGNRTDTIFVMSIEGGRVGLLAFPRDLFITRCDGTSGRINAAMAIGGPGCLVKTVSDLSGLAISHFMQVSFLGFRDIVDAVGGVDLCLEKAIQDPFSGADFQPGCQTLDGRQALAFVRVRKIDNDLERIKRQQQFLKALATKIVSPATAVNPVRLVETAGGIGRALTADDGLGTLTLLRVGFGLRGLATGNSITQTVPTTPATKGGAAVLLPIEGEADTLFASFRDGSVLDGVGGGTESDIPPEEISVRVLNGAGIEGAAGTVADELRTLGYDVVGVGNADQRDSTVVLYPAGMQAQAERVASEVPGGSAATEEDASVSEVTVVLGADAG